MVLLLIQLMAPDCYFFIFGKSELDQSCPKKIMKKLLTFTVFIR